MHDLFKLKIGTTQKIDPKVIYFEGRTFIKPLQEKEEYGYDILNIKRKFNKIIQRFIETNNLFSQKYILDIQVAKSGISMNKRSYLSFQCFLRQKDNNNILKLKDIKEKTENAIQNVLNDSTSYIEECEFSVSKTKH
jgi:hypothetical protein